MRLGRVRAAVGDDIGAPNLDVFSVGSHDTASAVVGVPMTSSSSAYISCGTWGLVGVELDEPVLRGEALAANFTNEGGVDGKTRFMTNVMGTWILSEAIRTWKRRGIDVELVPLLDAASTARSVVFDVQDPRFMPPGDMPARIEQWCREHGVEAPRSAPDMVRSIIDSIAQAFANALATTERLTGRPIDVVHMVGGGSQNALLCQATARLSGKQVEAGPVEATALGNVLIQARTLGAVPEGLAGLRELIAHTHATVSYNP